MDFSFILEFAISHSLLSIALASIHIFIVAVTTSTKVIKHVLIRFTSACTHLLHFVLS